MQMISGEGNDSVLAQLSDFQSPADLDTVIALRQEHGDRALVVAGGTFIHGLVARGLLDDVSMVIDISRLGLDRIERSETGLRVGATATYGALADAVGREACYGALADAMACPPPQISNVATVGGSLAASCPLFDLPVALAALGTDIVVGGPAGKVIHAIDTFFTGLFTSALAEDEIITGVNIPGNDKVVSGFAKLETNANDLAIINAAAGLTFARTLLSRKWKCTGARIWVGGGVGETIRRLPSVESVLAQGEELDAATISAAAAAAARDVTAAGDHRASAPYRQKMIAVYVEKAIGRAMDRLG